MPHAASSLPQIIHTIAPEEIYTDRAEPLAYLYQAALKAITRRSMSTVLLGQRRMGAVVQLNGMLRWMRNFYLKSQSVNSMTLFFNPLILLSSHLTEPVLR